LGYPYTEVARQAGVCAQVDKMFIQDLDILPSKQKETSDSGQANQTCLVLPLL
jgi:hypothetical protein